MEQLVILVIIGLISLVNWLIQRSAEARERRKLERKREGLPDGDPFLSGQGGPPPPQPTEPTPAASNSAPNLAPDPAADPAREMRRLMEAFGIPMEPDEPLPQERIRPPAPPVPPELPPPVFCPPVLARERIVSAQAARPFDLPSTARSPVSPVSSLLRTRTAARQAIVLREILGPPKAFQ